MHYGASNSFPFGIFFCISKPSLCHPLTFSSRYCDETLVSSTSVVRLKDNSGSASSEQKKSHGESQILKQKELYYYVSTEILNTNYEWILGFWFYFNGKHDGVSLFNIYATFNIISNSVLYSLNSYQIYSLK